MPDAVYNGSLMQRYFVVFFYVYNAELFIIEANVFLNEYKTRQPHTEGDNRFDTRSSIRIRQSRKNHFKRGVRNELAPTAAEFRRSETFSCVLIHHERTKSDSPTPKYVSHTHAYTRLAQSRLSSVKRARRPVGQCVSCD